MKSLKETLALTPTAQREELLAQWDDEMVESALRDAWWFTGRPEQFPPPGDWLIWLLMAGRGWGKTRTGAEWLIEAVEAEPEVNGVPTEWAVIGETFPEVRDVCLDGPAGIRRALMKRGMEDEKDYRVNKQTWQINFASGAKVYLLSAKDPDVGRGFSLTGVWMDGEPCSEAAGCSGRTGTSSRNRPWRSRCRSDHTCPGRPAPSQPR